MPTVRAPLSAVAGLLRPLVERRRKLFWLLAAATLAADLATKHLLWSHPRDGREPIVVIPHVLQFVSHEGNRQGALGLGPQSPGFFIAAAVVGLVLLIYFLLSTDAGHGLLHGALGLLAGGAVGNLADRACLGYVRDFIDLHWKDAYHWHTFNTADAAICVGFAAVLYDALAARRRGQAAAAGEGA